jgi:hypothetical protein
MLANLRALFGVVVDIVLMRRGPEQLPASTVLLAAVVALSIIESSFMAFVAPVSVPAAFLQALVGAAVLLLWFRAALGIAGKPERFTQTMTGIFGVNVLFTPAMLPLIGALMPYMEKADPKNQPPAALVIVTLLIGVWALVVYVRIVRVAFDCPWVIAFLLVVAEFFAGVVISSMLFGEAPNPA